MKRRTCPKCNEILGEYDYFFCSSCGTKLPEELVKKPRSIRIKTYKLEDVVKKSLPPFVTKLKNKKFIYSFFLLIFIAVVLFGIYSTGIFDLLIKTGPQTASVSIPQKVQEESNIVVDSELNWQAGNFTDVNLAKYYPTETDFYFEAFDLKNFSQLFINANNKAEENAVIDNTTDEADKGEAVVEEGEEEVNEEQPTKKFAESGIPEIFSRSDILFESSFAGAYLEDFDSWVFIFKIKDLGLVQRLLEEVESEKWTFSITDSNLYMVQNPEVISVFSEVRSGVVPNFSQEPKYAQRIKNLPGEGKIRVVIMNKQVQEGLDKYFEILGSDVENILTKIINTEQPALVIQ